jgi:hypothetical protein|tara:strand:+ start:14183 stop:15277 length:1095 start_codon:yes stop_codon:yes gene_type:complete
MQPTAIKRISIGGKRMTPHENFQLYWDGERPERIPFSIYGAFCGSLRENPDWVALFERGLVPTYWVSTISKSAKDVERVVNTYQEDGNTMRRTTLKTPVGEIYTTALVAQNTVPYWPQKYWLATAEDFRVRTWIVENTEISPAFDNYDELQKQVAPWGLVLPMIGRTPIQTILVDDAGLEQFSYHLVDLEDEMMTLYQVLLVNFRKIVEINAEGPGRYIECAENFTAETLGPVRYEQFLLPVYKECLPMLHQAGKIVGTHYDGKLSSTRQAIAAAPIDHIESFTEPPEGDMTLAECRAVWPEKGIWSNINVGLFDLPADQLQIEIRRKVLEGAPDGRLLALEISEDLPVNWQQGIPAIMDELGY